MADTVNALAGRKWKLSRDKKDSVTRKYRCVLDAPIALNSEGGKITGVPSVGDEHPVNESLEVASVEYEEESSSGGQKIVVATVSYEPKESQTQTIVHEEETVSYRVDEWGWSAGTEDRDLIEDVDSTAQNRKKVVNSAGDPFDSAPKVSVSAPVFTKVMKFKTRQSGAMDFNSMVNDAAVTIGDMSCAIATLLCSVSEKRIFGDKDWNYQYTVSLKFKSNKVILLGDNAKTEVGWDAAVADVGMRQKDVEDSTGKKRVLIRMRDQETGEPCVVSSPAVLDGNGYAISDTDENRDPRILRFKAYERASFPSWFYSEPPIPTEDQDDEEDEDDVANN